MYEEEICPQLERSFLQNIYVITKGKRVAPQWRSMADTKVHLIANVQTEKRVAWQDAMRRAVIFLPKIYNFHLKGATSDKSKLHKITGLSSSESPRS